MFIELVYVLEIVVTCIYLTNDIEV